MPLKDKRLRSEYMRKYNESRRDTGLCRSCNNPVLWKDGRPQTLCRYHTNLDRRRKANKIYEEQRCCSCGTIHAMYHGKLRCPECTRKYNEYRKNRYHTLKKAGLCTNCGKQESIKGKVRCRVCSQMFSQAQIRYKKNRTNRENKENKENKAANIKKNTNGRKKVA